MFEQAAAYIAAIFAMLFAGASALTLIHIVNHLDAEVRSSPDDAREVAAV